MVLLTPVKTRYLLTSIMLPCHGLSFRAHQGHLYLINADQILVFDWIVGLCDYQVNLL